MSIEHKNITDPDVHEPKGCSTAAVDRVYVANGTGSGTWKKLESKSLSGIDGDSGVANRTIASDGAGGFKLQDTVSYGCMKIVNNNNAFALTAIADTTFNTPSQFTLVTGANAPWAAGELQNITFTTDRLTFTKAGVYQLMAYLNIASFPGNNAKVGIRYRVNGTSYSDLKAIIKVATATESSQIFGAGFLTAEAGDYVQLMIASDLTGNVVINDANFIASIISHG